MSSYLTLSRVAVATCNFINCTVDALSKKERNDLKNESTTLKWLTAALDAIAGISRTAGASLETLKIINLTQSMSSMWFTMIVVGNEYNNPDFSWSNYISKATPFINTVFYFNEALVLEQQIHLEMLDKDPNAQRPIYELTGGTERCGDEQCSSTRIVGYRPIDRKECQREIASAQNVQQFAAVARVAAETHVIGEIFDNFEVFFLRRFGNKINFEQIPLNYYSAQDTIPECLHDDVVLKTYCCAITKKPIRHVTGDPDGVTLYEIDAITQWLAENATSPATGKELLLHQLTEEFGIQAMISMRLAKHDALFADYLKKRMVLMSKDIVSEQERKKKL